MTLMARAKSNANPFLGRWRILMMTEWEEDYVHEEEEGYFEFREKDQGEFHFGYVHGHMDCRLTSRDGAPAMEWSWDGNDEMDQVSGRGWATIADGDLVGMIFVHQQNESGFAARKKPSKKGG